MFVRTHASQTDDDPTLQHVEQYAALRLAAIDHKRSTMLRLRDEQRIDDTVFRRLQAALDVEEM
ncbi:hypothetical protein OG782_00620 [Streptomyces sp. NBC_00876]|uniref:hypothetical protein n=1 Tax=Streptomyces sp. NBC_00876 TaxID=2975853 RepID=UPI0038639083|nr:hypothetical protein OG782_00620 [Streptomyces sp. NBC_00876]